MVIIIKNFFVKYLSILFISFVTLLVIFSMLVLTNKLNDQNSSYTYLMGVILLFISGLVLSNHYQKQGFFVGFLQALCFVIIFCLINVLAYDNSISFSNVIKMLIYLVSGILGGVVGVNIKKLI